MAQQEHTPDMTKMTSTATGQLMLYGAPCICGTDGCWFGTAAHVPYPPMDCWVDNFTGRAPGHWDIECEQCGSRTHSQENCASVAGGNQGADEPQEYRF